MGAGTCAPENRLHLSQTRNCEMNSILNISIVIPTNGRVSLVERLLKSLVPERNSYKYGKTEIIVVNSGNNEDSEQIKKLCKDYDAQFFEGENSVRKKRNLGIKKASYEVILFLDSDVAAEPGLLNLHAAKYLNSDEKNLGGVFGLTKFVGEKRWWWKVVEQTTYLDSFSFAERFPYNSWTIGNNVSFYKSVLFEVGLFEENFPYPLGGDDLDLTYRITKTGYLIKSCPEAVTLHSTETWNHFKAIYDRTRRWGSMEYYISKRHPEIFVNCIPKSCIMFLFMMILCSVIALCAQRITPLVFFDFWWILHYFALYLYDCIHKNGGNPVWYLLGKSIRVWYRLYYEVESLKNGDFSCFHKEMSFSLDQTKFMLQREIFALKSFFVTFAALLCTFLVGSLII